MEKNFNISIKGAPMLKKKYKKEFDYEANI